MGITVKVGELVVPKGMRDRLVRIMADEVAPVAGEFLVKQIAYTHDVQGRSEDDQHGVWPPRKVPTSGIVVFSQRSELKRAIRQMTKDKAKGQLKETYAIKQQTLKHPDMTGVGRYGKEGTFTHRQLLGAVLALDQEARQKARKKELKLELADEMRKGEAASADRVAELQGLMKQIPRPITSLKSSRDSMRYRPRPVLFVTGTLRDSWNWKVRAEGRKVILYIGTTVKYAKAHFDGVPSKNIPARKEFVLTKKDRIMMNELHNDIVSKEFGRLFKRRRVG